MFGLTAFKLKLIGGGLIIALLASAYFFVSGLISENDKLKTEVVLLDEAKKSADATIIETERRVDVIDSIDNEGNRQRKIIEKDYQTKIDKVNDSVQEGKDKEVGPLLNDFFNKQ